MRVWRDHHAAAGHRGGASARWRGAAVVAVVAAAALRWRPAGARLGGGRLHRDRHHPRGLLPAAVAVDPAAGTVYVTNANDGTVSVIDAATNAVTATIPVGTYPYGVAVDPAAGTVYVTNYGDATVSVIDAATRAVTATIPRAPARTGWRWTPPPGPST